MNQPQQPHGHPLLAGLVAGISVTVVRRYARACIEREQDSDAADQFFHRADRQAVIGVLIFAASFLLGMIVSYASLSLAFLLILGGLVALLMNVVPNGATMMTLAMREMEYRRMTRGSLSQRLYQTGHDYAPRIFQ